MVLNIILVTLSIAFAVTGSLTFWPVEFLYDFYKPLVLFVGGCIGGLILIYIFYDIMGRIVGSMTKEYSRPGTFARTLFIWAIDFIDRHARIKLTIKGRNKFPTTERFLLVCNHKSRFDSMIITQFFGKKDIAFLTKRDNMKIPLAGRLMNRICYLPLDRHDKFQSLNQMRRAEVLLKENVSSVGVFPEGTRIPDDIVLGDFHEGVFNIALKARVPILVCTVKHTHDVHRNWPWKATNVELNILGLIAYEEIEGKTAKHVSDEVHELMLNALTN